MTARRLSKLQHRILQKMWTQDERTQGGISTGHLEWVQTLGRDKSNISHSLRTLEACKHRQWILYLSEELSRLDFSGVKNS